MTKIGLIIGHNARAQGAVRVTDKRTEHDWCGLLAAMILSLDRDRYQIISRPPGLAYIREIAAAYGAADRTGVAATIELHFNSAASELATGTETLSSGTKGSLRLAGLVQQAQLRALGLRDRGVKIIGRRDRGGESLFAGKAPAILIEPYFGSRRLDCQAADAGMTALAREIHAACTAFLSNSGA